MDSVFKQTLRDEMEYKDIRVKELALRTGISQRTLESYLGARGSIPPADVAVKIANALNVSVEYLVTGKRATEERLVAEQDFSRDVSEGHKELLKKISKVLKEFDITSCKAGK